MADLEELGFIEKTHSSSGRVPSEKGYRYYVDHLLSPVKLTKSDLDQIHSIFKEKIFEPGEDSSKISANFVRSDELHIHRTRAEAE